ncbi:hypothetical protein INR49_023088 [Caranx melampygus]|nr:hypothetical protein INR49_023088 [Caranx melampygus]
MHPSRFSDNNRQNHTYNEPVLHDKAADTSTKPTDVMWTGRCFCFYMTLTEGEDVQLAAALCGFRGPERSFQRRYSCLTSPFSFLLILEYGLSVSSMMKSYRTFTHDPASWDAGKVVVLVVVAHVEGEKVEGAVVRVGLMALEEHVVLSYEVTRDGVQAHPQHGASQHVDHRLGPPEPVEQNVEGELDGHIGQLQLTDGLGVDAERSDGIKQRLQDNPDELPEACAEEPAFKLSGDVYIHAVSTQVAMMVQVVAFEGGRVGQTDGVIIIHLSVHQDVNCDFQSFFPQSPSHEWFRSSTEKKLQTKKTKVQPQYGLTANLASQGKRRVCTEGGQSAAAEEAQTSTTSTVTAKQPQVQLLTSNSPVKGGDATRLDCRGRSGLFLVRFSDDPPSPSASIVIEAAARLPAANAVPDVLVTVEDTAVLLDVEGTAVLGLGPPMAAALLSISSRSLCSSSASRAFCSPITWVCSSSFCSWSCSCFCCSSCLTRISCISLRSTVIDAPFTFTCCCTLVISERDATMSSFEKIPLLSYRTQMLPGAEPMRRPDRSAPGSFFFRMGTIFSSKYSMAMEEISLSSWRTSCAL